MKPIYSMTGFAGVQGQTKGGTEFSLTLRGVNHRYLDLALRLPPGCEELEMQLRRLLKERVRRGHVDVTVQVARREGAGRLQLNEELLSAYIVAFRRAAEQYYFTAEPDLNAILRQPGVLKAETAVIDDPAALQRGVLEVLPVVLERFDAVRGQEGASLAVEMAAGMRRLEILATEVTGLRGGVRTAYAERLRVRMAELLQGAVGEERVLAEAALLAERSDIDEELVRLQTHTERFLLLMEGGGELGKRLDFLLQELAREANTLLSKTSGAMTGQSLRITELGLEMKLEIERAREQVQNLE